MTEHSNKIGGSSAARAIACPGSIPLSAKVPRKTSEFAAVGTALHNCMEQLLENPDMEISSLLGTKQTVDGYEIEITQELIDNKITPALKSFDHFLDDLESIGGGEADFAIEARVEWGVPLIGCFGTADVVGRAGDTAFVLDWKFGDGVMVDAADNKQLMFYAGAAAESKGTAHYFEDVKRIWIAIVQPTDRADNMAYAEVTFKELDVLRNELVQAIANSSKGLEAMKLGDHCRWCPAKPNCPLMHNAAADAVDSGVNLAHLEEDLRLASDLESWITAVRKLAHETMDAGTDVPGWKLVAKRAMRKWKDVDALKKWARKHGSVKKLFKETCVTPAAAAKIIDVPEEFIIKQSSGTTIAPESDKRPAVHSTAGIGKIAEMAGIKT